MADSGRGVDVDPRRPTSSLEWDHLSPKNLSLEHRGERRALEDACVYRVVFGLEPIDQDVCVSVAQEVGFPDIYDPCRE